jgi:hypothetical protein
MAPLFGYSTAPPPNNVYIARIAINNFATRSLVLQRFFLRCVFSFGTRFNITSLISLQKDMSEVIMNPFPKKKNTMD